MTTSPEAFLAREAELCYAVMAHITDYDVWHIEEVPVSVEAVIAVLTRNTQIAQQSVANLARELPAERSCACGHALRDALITNPAGHPARNPPKTGPAGRQIPEVAIANPMRMTAEVPLRATGATAP